MAKSISAKPGNNPREGKRELNHPMTQQPETVWVLHDTGNLIPPEDDIRVFVDKPALMFGLRRYVNDRHPNVATELKFDEWSPLPPASENFH
jgi:hypothetical protein